MPAGLSEPAGPAPRAGVSSSGTLTGPPAGARPVRAESTSEAPGAVTKAPVHVRVEPARPPNSVGTLAAKVAPVSALPAAQLVTVKAPATTTLQLPASLQLPPGRWVPGVSGPAARADSGAPGTERRAPRALSVLLPGAGGDDAGVRAPHFPSEPRLVWPRRALCLPPGCSEALLPRVCQRLCPDQLPERYLLSSAEKLSELRVGQLTSHSLQ